MSKIMYKDKQILGCISDAQYVAFNNTDTGLSATNVQNAITEVNGKLVKLEALKIQLGVTTTLSPGNFTLEFPTKKEGYAPIAIKSWALYNRDSADNIHINGVVIGLNAVTVEGKLSGSNKVTIPSNAFVEVLYLVN